ncbi:MAG: penicillin-binding protein 2 [Patescibacteria group bacterium]|nr:penicillin-binding protein 2 [Patescibacteria group bacterium]
MKFSRIDFIYLLIFLVGGIIISRLVFLQIIKGEFYRALANGQQEIFQSISGQRGEIFLYDKDKLVLVATNKGRQFCYVSPKMISNKEGIAELIAPILDIDKEKFLTQLEDNKDKLFLLVKRKISSEEADKVIELNLEGVYLDQERLRYYPYNDLASDVLGFVNKDDKGQYGIEGYWNDLLIGKEGWQKVDYGPFGRFLRGDNNGSIKGVDIVLTIDKNIQAQAESLVKEFSEDFGFETAQIIVIRPSDSRILALIDYPAFNPNEYQSYAEKKDIELFKNKAIQALYEPGSVFKAVTMASALNEGKIKPDTIYIDKGHLTIRDREISNYDNRIWGKSTMTEVLERSINTGAVFAQSQISNTAFLDYLTRFGLFEKTEVKLQGEVYSENKEFKKGWDINFATASFGHGIEMTPLQMIKIYGAIANHGTLVPPYIVEGVVEDGQVKKIDRENDSKQIILSQTALDTTKMLVSVTEEGYGKPARIPGYYVAGKTGTSLIPYSSLDINQSGYSDQTWQSFVGFAPAFDPEFVIIVKLDNPNTRTASESAIHIFQKLGKYILDYYQIPPDRDL